MDFQDVEDASFLLFLLAVIEEKIFCSIHTIHDPRLSLIHRGCKRILISFRCKTQLIIKTK
jgi:hypothetical protein